MSYPNTELTEAVRSMVERIGVDTQTPARSTDAGIWAALTESGFTAMGVPESVGGAGGSVAEVLSVISAATYSGALTPLVEYTVAAWLAGESGYEIHTSTAAVGVVDDAATVRSHDDNGTTMLDGTVTDIVHAGNAETIVLLLASATADERPTTVVVSTTADGVAVSEGTDLLGAPISDVTFTATPVTFAAESPIDVDTARDRAALSYAVAISAAACAVRDRTLRYASERQQFGRPLAKFQAIQQNLAWLAALTAMIETATATAVDAATIGSGHAHSAIATAKLVASENAHEVAAIAHQIHGAIGFTSEHPLGRFTTALWSWRDRHGSERDWADVLARRVLDDGDDVWDVIVGRAPTPVETIVKRDPA